MKRIFLLFLTFFSSFSIFAQKYTLLEAGFSEQKVKRNIKIYNEKINEKETIEKILLKPSEFKVSESAIPSFWISNVGHWLSFNLKSQSDQECIVNINYDAFKEVDFYVFNKQNKEIERFKTLGWQIPISQRILKSNFYAFQFRPKKNVEYEIFMRVKKPRGSIKVPIFLVSPESFKKANENLFSYYGFFIGCIFIASILTLFLFITTKDRAYLYYALSAISMLIWRIYFEGFFWVYFSDRNSFLADSSYGNVLLLLFIFFHLSFIKRFLLQDDKSPTLLLKLGRYMQVLIISIFIPLVIIPFEDSGSKIIGYFFYSLYVIYLVILFFYLKDAFSRKSKSAYFYVLSFIPFLINSSVGLMSNLNVISSDFLFFNSYLWAFLFEMIILSFGLAFRFQDMQKTKIRLLTNLNKKQKEIFENEKIKKDAEFKKIEAQLKLQTEKTRISRDLHDSVGSQLTYLISSLDYLAVKTNVDQIVSTKIENLSDYTRTTMQQLRDTIWTINKEQVNLTQFTERINNYVIKQIENIENLDFEFITNFDSKDKMILSFQMLHSYRIIQESINNTIKHAQATQIILNIQVVDDLISFKYKDNGLGFETSKVDTSNHFGLTNIQNRIEEMEGEYSLKSKLMEGTELFFSFKLLNTPNSVLV